MLHQLALNGNGKVALFEHPPASVRRPVKVPSGRPLLRFSIGLDQSVWSPDKGDGVAFEVSVETENGRQSVYRRRIDPKHDSAQRRWLNERVDLSRYAGRDVTLIFTTEALADASFDWANWGDVRIENGAGPDPATTGYALVYDDEVTIYENQHVMPRAFIPSAVTAVATRDDATALLASGTLDVHHAAVVESDMPEPLQGLGSEGSATIRSDAGQRVVVDVEAPSRALLVLTDLYYPGWVAAVDGQPAEIYATDLAFRGVVIPSGRHVVEFTYRPWSFGIGVALALAALAVLALAVAAPRFVLKRWSLKRPELLPQPATPEPLARRAEASEL
jgi:hypothetical protein